MKNVYEYWTTFLIDGEMEDYSIELKVISFSGCRGNSRADNPDDYYGYVDIEWEALQDISFMTESQIQEMEDWLVNEHMEYLKDEAYYD